MKCLQFLLVSLLIYTSSFGQKKYSFDYMIEYDYQYTDTSKVVKKYILTNSKDNSYYLSVIEKDSLNVTLSFIDYNGIRSIAYLDKGRFSKAEAVTLECKIVSAYENPFKWQTKNYNFINKNDTLIEGKYYSQYIHKSNKPKREKRKKFGTYVYVVEENTSFHLPILEHATAYEEWKVEKNAPNGISKLIYFKPYNGNRKELIHKLVQYVKINKSIIIPEECNYSILKSQIHNESHHNYHWR